MRAISVQISIPKYPSSFDHLDKHQYEGKISVGVDKEATEKVEELERKLKQIKGSDSIGSVNLLIYMSIRI